MSEEKLENEELFDQSATRLKGVKNIITPSGVVMRVTDTDLKWFNHFYTFEVQGKKCYQSIKTIAGKMGRAVSVAQDRINNLESLGLLTVGKEPFNQGWRNTYTCTSIDVIVSRKTDAKVTPQDKKLKKSQLNSLLKKSEAVDALAINQGIKEMAKAIAGRDLSDSEVTQFAFQIAVEKLAVLGWNIETTAKEDGKSDEKVKPQAEQAPQAAKQAAPAATPSTDAPADESTDTPADQGVGMAPEPAPVVAGQCYRVASNDDHRGYDRAAGNHEVKQEQPKIFDEHGVITEAFIDSLTGDGAPRRNDDGTLKSYAYTYRLARAYEAHRCGKPDAEIMDCLDTWMKQAQPQHIPPHLLPKQVAEPEYINDIKF